MALKCNPELERDLHTFNEINMVDVKTIKSKDPCCVCLIINKEWESYCLPCEHIAHTRCYRRWLFLRNKPDCAICGTIQWKNETEIIINDNLAQVLENEDEYMHFVKMLIYAGNNNSHTKVLKIHDTSLNNITIEPINKFNDHEFGNRPREIDILIEFKLENDDVNRCLELSFHKGMYNLKWIKKTINVAEEISD